MYIGYIVLNTKNAVHKCNLCWDKWSEITFQKYTTGNDNYKCPFEKFPIYGIELQMNDHTIHVFLVQQRC